MRRFKEQFPENHYIDTAMVKLKEDLTRDTKMFKMRELEQGAIARLFFSRFTGNQVDWTEDHDFIF